MCGIAGLIKKNSSQVYREEVKKMTDTLVHRGPDAEGQFVQGNVGLGHRRLSIIDLSEQGKQPMESYDGKYAIVFNGEIYNYIELKEELKSLHGKFMSNTDTEVIMEAYRCWGKDCVKHFNGMWAFALLDREQNVIFASRDRMGVKPFYYVDREDIFIFGSEPKAILELLPEERQYNPTMVYRFLNNQPEDMDNQTFYKNIFQLEPAVALTYDLENNQWNQWKYWEIDADEIYEKRIKGKDLVVEFRRLLEDAIRLRLRSDVPVGSSLSGGLDSSTIVGILSKKLHTKVKTFSSIYEDDDCNEKEYIDIVNQFAETDIHLVYPDEDTHLLDAFEKIVLHHDGPNSSASLYSGYSVYKEAKQEVKVLMDGQGADELLGGYLGSYFSRLADILSRNTLRSKMEAMKLISIFQKEWPEKSDTLPSDMMRQAMGKRVARKFPHKRSVKFSKHMDLFYEEFIQNVNRDIVREKGKVKGELNAALYYQLMQSSLPQILHNVDGNSMAFSLEVRLPFLDYRIVEFCMALDGSYKIRNQWTKWILRKSCKSYLPEKVLYRTNKMGFPAPFGRWLKECEEKDRMKEIIFALGDRGIVKKEAIAEYYRQHMSGEVDRSTILYRFLTLEIWLRRCIN